MKQLTLSIPKQQGKFIIWGTPPGEKYEILLLSEEYGLLTPQEAEKAKTALETKYKCKNVRISEIDNTAPDFTKTINL